MRPLLIALFLTFCFHGFSQKIKIGAAPAWLVKPVIDSKKITSPDEVSNGYLLRLYERQTNLVNQTVYTHYVRKIFNETGVQNASEVSVSYAPQYERLTFHYINVVRDGKIVSSVGEAEIRVVDQEDESDDFLYSGTKRAYVILKGIKKNDEIDCAYSVNGFNPVFGKYYSDKIFFVSGVQTENYFESIITPATQQLFVKPFNNAPLPEINTEGNLKIYQWKNPPIGEWKWQSSMPTWFEEESYVSVSTYKDWKEVIDWGTTLFQQYNYPLPKSLKLMIEDWRRLAAGNKDVFASLATQFVQDEIRYLGMEIGTHTHEPHSPAEVFESRYGDCKDKALLLTTILRQENINAYVALVNTSAKKAVADALPTAVAFNHAIVAVPHTEQKGYRYIDATITNQRGPFEGLFVPAYGSALVLNQAENNLQPADWTGSNNTEISEVFHLSFTAPSRLTVKTKFRGKAADRNRDDFSGMSIKELGDNYLDFYQKTYEGIELGSAVKIEDDSATNEISVVEQYSIPKAWKAEEKNKKTFTFAAQTIYAKIPDPSDVPQGRPMALEYPLTMTYAIQLYMPEDWPAIFKAVHISNESFQFDFTPRVDGNVIYLEYYYKTNKDHIPANMIEVYKKDFNKIAGTVQYELFKSGDTFPSGENITNPSAPIDIHWPALMYMLLTLMLTGGLMFYLNKTSVAVEFDESTAWKITGWTLFLGISISLGLLVNVFQLFRDGYLLEGTWTALKDAGGSSLQSLAIVEVVLQVMWIVFNAALVFWFIQRRDIFPKMFVWYAGSMLLGQLLLVILFSMNANTVVTTDMTNQLIFGLVRTLIYCAIWVTYVQKSQNVKNTFLKSYKG
jgi:hypothetical protein